MSDDGLTLRQAAKRLMALGGKIDRATTEDEENRLCDERDKLLAMMRKADEALASRPSPDEKLREALAALEKVTQICRRMHQDEEPAAAPPDLEYAERLLALATERK